MGEDVLYWLATLPAGYIWRSEVGQIVGPDGRTVASAGDYVSVDGEVFEPGGHTVCVSVHSVHVKKLGRAQPPAS